MVVGESGNAAARRGEVTANALIKPPFALPIARAYLGLGYLLLRRYLEAVTTLREFVSHSPNHRPGRCWLAAAYAHLGQLEDAQVREKEVQLAEMLINELTEKKFNPLQFHDEYREGVRFLQSGDARALLKK